MCTSWAAPLLKDSTTYQELMSTMRKRSILLSSHICHFRVVLSARLLIIVFFMPINMPCPLSLPTIPNLGQSGFSSNRLALVGVDRRINTVATRMQRMSSVSNGPPIRLCVFFCLNDEPGCGFRLCCARQLPCAL